MATSPKPKVKINNKSTRPVWAHDSTELSFYAALVEVEHGKEITKLEWSNPNIVVALKGENLMIFRADTDSLWHDLVVRYADMVGKDWIVV